MIPSEDGRDNVDDWYFRENQRRQNGHDSATLNDGQHETEDGRAKKKTKDFIANELHAMSTLSLYDDELDKVKMPGEGDK